MKIAFDGVRLAKKPMGVTNIGISIINTYARLCPEHTFYILTNGDLHPEVQSKLQLRDNIKIINSPLPVFGSIGFLWSILRFHRLLRKIKPDILIAPNFFVVTWFLPKKMKLILYVHDLVYKQYKDTMQLITKVQMELFFEKSLQRADIIWLNSAYTEQEFTKYYPAIAGKAQLFTGAGINPGFLQRIAQPAIRSNPFYNSIGERKEYMLFVGTIEPRKNLAFLLRLFKDLEPGKYQLVIVGDPGWGDMRRHIDEILHEKDYPAGSVHFIGYVSDDELIALYRDAAFFISASLNEGLGLPQLEAMACGCPVIAPHNSAMIEVVHGAGLTVKGWDHRDWQAAIRDLTINRMHYIEMGYARVKEYNWEDIVIRLDNHLAGGTTFSGRMAAARQLTSVN
ncbi:glycosyltransferase family 1 protein [Flavitalea sp. BT771]|uniref:glycosyltransferase family 4 protein n=1 Tax=Flavitalea sp. BT771 TaxID=3063329 RepID=UPI0026E23C84|nr:glycosyltransferase family 1 protein [Flavitalea sp. BT771]MDO6431489.1 glycosyltransferase family 1 protein [Flavitalea sp. BT771]MDV6220397.1 glycosyltransferase family 1 protein [Flavitalea sp. BT771]